MPDGARQTSDWDGMQTYWVYVNEENLRPRNVPSLPVFNEENQGTAPLAGNCHMFLYNVRIPNASGLAPGTYILLVPAPGAMGGAATYVMNPENLYESLIADGCLPVTQREQARITPQPGHYLGAAFLDGSGSRYHFLRRHEPSGIWYQRDGWGALVTNLDKKNRIILDPLQADLGGYKNFVGFVQVPNEGIKLDIEVIPPAPAPVTKFHRVRKPSRSLALH